MRTFDLSPLFRSTVGFDRLAEMLDTVMTDEPVSYPPYNIEKTGDDAYRITLAVAGFGEDELSIEQRESVLLVSGQKKPANANGETYLHRGIAARSFTRQFQLADHVKVVSANLENGLLNVDLVREIPEEMKPRKIEINRGKPATIVEKAKTFLEGKAA